MPTSPPTLTALHNGSRDERERSRKRDLDTHRGSARQRGYDSKWERYRRAYLARHPLCGHCQAEGRLTPATVIDHITDHRGDKSLFWLHSNHQPLCKRHHDMKTAATHLNKL